MIIEINVVNDILLVSVIILTYIWMVCRLTRVGGGLLSGVSIKLCERDSCTLACASH